jgi:uncharacterized protein
MISSDLTVQIQEALKSGDKARVSVLRLLSSALKRAEVEKRGELNEEESIAVIAREVRKREEAAEEYASAGRSDRADIERSEAEILKAWLPAALSEEELSELVDDAVAESRAAGPTDLGKVMKVLMPKVSGRADGKRVSELVRQRLQTS